MSAVLLTPPAYVVGIGAISPKSATSFGIDPLLLALDPGSVNEEFAARLGEECQVVRADSKVRGLLPAVGHNHVAPVAVAATEV